MANNIIINNIDIVSSVNPIIPVNINYEDLEKLRKNIEPMNKSHHVEIAKILKKHNCHLNENNNGIFVNLNDISDYIIDQIKEYLHFIKNQETYLNEDEKTKENLENIYFKDNKDNLDKLNSTIENTLNE
tara:strand:+ start:1972 stop:2361 length:390 start_codon:yes stop_codon:yes gene_type:complete